MKRVAILAAVAASAISSAVVVPNSAVGADADGQFFLTTTAAAGRTYQLLIGANQLTGLLNNNLTGFAFRLNNTATAAYPGAAASFADFEVRLGAGVAPSAMSNTFAANFTAGSTLVRDGGMSWAAGSFASGGNPNAFGPAIDFNQTSYLYTGGDLLIEMRFSAVTGFTTAPAFDAVNASGGPGNGWGVNYAGRWTGNSAGTTGANGNFLVTDLQGTPVPEPATMIALGAGAVALARRRRK